VAWLDKEKWTDCARRASEIAGFPVADKLAKDGRVSYKQKSCPLDMDKVNGLSARIMRIRLAQAEELEDEKLDEKRHRKNALSDSPSKFDQAELDKGLGGAIEGGKIPTFGGWSMYLPCDTPNVYYYSHLDLMPT
jgi:hypothetical protein